MINCSNKIFNHVCEALIDALISAALKVGEKIDANPEKFFKQPTSLFLPGPTRPMEPWWEDLPFDQSKLRN